MSGNHWNQVITRLDRRRPLEKCLMSDFRFIFVGASLAMSISGDQRRGTRFHIRSRPESHAEAPRAQQRPNRAHEAATKDVEEPRIRRILSHQAHRAERRAGN